MDSTIPNLISDKYKTMLKAPQLFLLLGKLIRQPRFLILLLNGCIASRLNSQPILREDKQNRIHATKIHCSKQGEPGETKGRSIFKTAKDENIYTILTTSTPELGDSIDEPLMEVLRPSEPRLGIGGQNQTRVALVVVVGRPTLRIFNYAFVGAYQSRKHPLPLLLLLFCFNGESLKAPVPSASATATPQEPNNLSVDEEEEKDTEKGETK